MPRPKIDYIFVDFDLTLFDHVEFRNWMDNELHSMGKLPKGQGSFKDSLDDYHEVKSKKPLMRIYDHHRHFKESTTGIWNDLSDRLKERLHSQGADFCYKDAHEFMDWLKTQEAAPAILTYGVDEYQLYKLGLCTYIDHMKFPLHIVREPKTDFLRREYPRGLGVLIDDKHPLNLPQNWIHVWLNRNVDQKPQKLSSGTISISSLSQIPALQDQILQQILQHLQQG